MNEGNGNSDECGYYRVRVDTPVSFGSSPRRKNRPTAFKNRHARMFAVYTYRSDINKYIRLIE
jgi:hypothetical protein